MRSVQAAIQTGIKFLRELPPNLSGFVEVSINGVTAYTIQDFGHNGQHQISVTQRAGLMNIYTLNDSPSINVELETDQFSLDLRSNNNRKMQDRVDTERVKVYGFKTPLQTQLRSVDLSKYPQYRADARAWTTEIYRNIQDSMRKRRSNRLSRITDRKQGLIKYMLLLARRSPSLPRQAKHVTHLYRGLHGPLVNQLLKYGTIDDKGFIATTPSKKVADKFATRQFMKGVFGVVLSIELSEIPKGTPWIWFGYDAHSEAPKEQEVLLPPGRLTLKPAPKAGRSKVLRVIYAPSL